MRPDPRAPYEPVILHADMDAFYASVEQRDRPELRGQPVVVGGTSDRGVVTAASYEARRFGIHSAMPTVRARTLCPHAHFIQGDMGKYRRISAQLRRTFASVSSVVEPIALDEAFMDVTGSIALLGLPLRIGRQLKQRIREETGLTVSVGIGPGKMIAKIASDASKPDGLLEVPPDEVEAFLRPLSVRRLWGVGPVTADALKGFGVDSIGDLVDCPLDVLVTGVGQHAADHLSRLARGMDPRAVEPDRAARSIGEEGTLEADTTDPSVVRAAIIAHAETVARRLRGAHLRARVVVLKIKLARRLGGGKFRMVTRRTTLGSPTDDGLGLSAAALDLFDRLEERSAIRLVGVSVAGIEADDATEGEQLDLFGHRERDRRDRLNEALDRIVARFGPRSIARGASR